MGQTYTIDIIPCFKKKLSLFIIWKNSGQSKRQIPIWFIDSITEMLDYILAKQISPLRAALPSLQGQPVWQPGDIGLNIGEMLHKVKNGKGGRRGVCHDKRHTRVG